MQSLELVLRIYTLSAHSHSWLEHTASKSIKLEHEIGSGYLFFDLFYIEVIYSSFLIANIVTVPSLFLRVFCDVKIVSLLSHID
jgi:hypothetical protein